MAQPSRREARRAMACDQVGDGALIGLGGRGAKGERDLAQPQLEQAIAPARLAVVVPLRNGLAEDLDLPAVQAEASIGGGDPWFERAIVRQEEPRRASGEASGKLDGSSTTTSPGATSGRQKTSAWPAARLGSTMNCRPNGLAAASL